MRGCGCITCGAPADMYCGRCELAPYCSEQCQRKDWTRRHSAVCHNLVGQSKVGAAVTNAVEPLVDAKKEMEKIPQNTPLRRPHSPNRRNQNTREDSTGQKSVQSRLNQAEQRPAQRRPNVPENSRNGSANDQNYKRDNSYSKQRQPSKEYPPRDAKPIEKVEEPPKQAPTPKVIPTPKEVPTPKDVSTPKEVPIVKTTVKAEVKLVPEKYMVETLPPNETFVLSVDRPASESKAGDGFVCTTMHEDFEMSYNALVEDFAADCTPDTDYEPPIGDTYAYLDPSDGGWYRARRISPTSTVLLDAGRTVPTLNSTLCRLPDKYRVTPEFCCVIDKAEIGTSLQCTVISKTNTGVKVSVCEVGQEKSLGNAIITRWMPEILLPEVKPTPPPQTSQPQASQKTTPEVPRPTIQTNKKYVLVDVPSLKRACIRSCEHAGLFETIIQDVVLHGSTQEPLTEPPKPGQLVLGKFQDVHFRAMVLRTKVTENRYLIEYIEYGNQEVVQLSSLYPCPPQFDLTIRPTVASIVLLSDKEPFELTDPAKEFIEPLKEVEEMIANIPGGATSVPSGSLVQLQFAKNKASLNKKLQELCTPEWKKLEEKGGDVIESQSLMFQDMKYISLPTDRPFVLHVTDHSDLAKGHITGFERGASVKDVVYGPLTDKITAYARSELCAEPYLPKPEELCIAKIPPYNQWVRAVLMEQVGGPGGKKAQILCIDYGNIVTVPISNLRKMMAEFIEVPAIGNQCDINDWPSSVTEAQIKRATDLLYESTDEMCLSVRRATQDDSSIYILEAPVLIDAISRCW